MIFFLDLMNSVKWESSVRVVCERSQMKATACRNEYNQHLCQSFNTVKWASVFPWEKKTFFLRVPNPVNYTRYISHVPQGKLYYSYARSLYFLICLLCNQPNIYWSTVSIYFSRRADITRHFSLLPRKQYQISSWNLLSQEDLEETLFTL